MKQGDQVKRVKVGMKGEHGKGYEPAENIGEVGTVVRVQSWKWMKIDVNGVADWVRCEEFEEV